MDNKFKKGVKRLLDPIIGSFETDQLFKGNKSSAVVVRETPSHAAKGTLMAFVRKLPTCVRCKASISREPLRRGELCVPGKGLALDVGVCEDGRAV